MKPLTEQQEKVMNLVSQGMTNRQIAVALGLAEQTVKNCLSGVYQKMGVDNRVTAVLTYLKEN